MDRGNGTARNDGPSHNFRGNFPSHITRPARSSGLSISFGSAGLRIGYFQYAQNWNDSHFRYHSYGFTPGNSVVYSPWYYYSNLPPYINSSSVIYVDGYSRAVPSYRWQTYRRDAASQGAIDRIANAFQQDNAGPIISLVQPNSRVAILMDGQFQYDLVGEDFENMLSDMVQSTQTESYTVDAAHQYGDHLQVQGTQRFRDANGDTQTVHMEFVLVADRNGDFSITEFNSWQ